MVDALGRGTSEKSSDCQEERKLIFACPHSEKTREPADDTRLDLLMQAIATEICLTSRPQSQ
jgi:hypothetical protein